MATDVTLKSLVRAELDLAHIASSLLHADEVVDVDVSALDILKVVGQLACDPQLYHKRCYIPACTC